MNKFPYEDILSLPRHISTKHPPMPMSDRAAQFSPFAALTGYDDAVKETGRLTGTQMELTEEAKAFLDWKQQQLSTLDHPPVTVTYFVPDARKAGGEYISVSGTLKRIDSVARILLLDGGQKIPLDEVADIESPEISLDVVGNAEEQD